MDTLDILKNALLALGFCLCVSMASAQVASPRVELASRLDSALNVNATLKQLESDPSVPGYSVLHTQLQSSLRTMIDAAVTGVVQRLSSQPDWSLTMKLLDLSFRVGSVSVDTISNGLGQILLANPSFLAGSIRHLPKQQRASVIQHLKAGWVTVAAAIPATDARRVAAQSALDKLSKNL